MMASGQYLNPNISSINTVTHIESERDHAFSSGGNNKNYADMSNKEANDTIYGAPSRYYNGYYGYYNDTVKEVHSVGSPDFGISTTSGLISPTDPGACSDGFRKSCSLYQPPSCHLLEREASDPGVPGNQQQGYYSPHNFDDAHLHGNYNNNGGDSHPNPNEILVRQGQSLQPTWLPHDQFKDNGQHGGAVYTELQPLQRLQPKKVTIESNTAQGFHKLPFTSGVNNFQPCQGQFSQIPDLAHSSRVSQASSFIQPYSSGNALHRSWTFPSTDSKLAPQGTRSGLSSAVDGQVSPVIHGHSRSANYSPNQPGGQADRNFVQRNARKMGAGNIMSTWIARGRNNCAVTLYNGDMWAKFHSHTNEMIITKHGRRMFPVLHFMISGLDPDKYYQVYVDMIVADSSHWKFQEGKWVSCGHAEPLPIEGRTYHHPDSPNTGAHWMKQDINFGKLKLTNNKNSKQKQIILNSMHRYQPRIHIREHLDGKDGDVVLSHAFEDTQFIAVTAYMNASITELKVKFNPYARGMQDKNRLELYNSTQENCQSSANHQALPSVPLTTSISSTFGYGNPENLLEAARIHMGATSPGTSTPRMQDFVQRGHIVPPYTEGVQNSYRSFGRDTISSTPGNHHQNFLGVPPPQSLVSGSETPQSQGSSSSSHQPYFQSSEFNNPGSFLDHAKNTGAEAYIGTRKFKQEFHRAPSFDIGQDMAFLQHGNTCATSPSCAYIADSNVWSHHSPSAQFDSNGQYTRKPDLAISSPTSDSSYNRGFHKEDRSMHHQSMSTTAREMPQYLNLPSSMSISAGKSSTATKLQGSEYQSLSMNKTNRNQGHSSSEKTPELYTKIQQSCDMSKANSSFLQTQKTFQFNSWADGNKSFNAQPSSEGFLQASRSPLQTSLTGHAEGDYYSYSTNMLNDSQLRHQEQQQMNVEQLQSSFYQPVQQTSVYETQQMPSTAYSPLEQNRQQRLGTLHTLSARNRDLHEEAAKEYGKLQREAAELSLDFMARDVKLTSAKFESTASSNTASSSLGSSILSTSITVGTGEKTSLLSSKGNSDIYFEASCINNVSESAENRDCKQENIRKIASENKGQTSLYFQPVPNVEKPYPETQSMKCQELLNLCSKESAQQDVIPGSEWTSSMDRKEGKSLKRKAAEHMSQSKEMDPKKTKLSSAGAIV